jgi:hypothetical protein
MDWYISRPGPRGTPPVDFATDTEELHALLKHFCSLDGEFAPRAMFGQMSKTERMRYAYLYIDHHLRQFGAQSPTLQLTMM